MFVLLFALAWIKQAFDVVTTGSTDPVELYESGRIQFWIVRMFDLGVSIPLGLWASYLLIARPL